MKKISYTRGGGLLEGFLARKRALKANSFIGNKFKNGKVLDIGCGSYPHFLLAANIKNKYGIDPEVKRNLIKRKNLKLIKDEVSNKKLPFNKNFFDVITMLAVFEHIDESKITLVLSEAKRVLKKGGIFIITTPAPWSTKLLHLMAYLNLVSREEIHEHKHSLDKRIIEDRLIKAGFERNKMKSGFFELGLNMWFVAKKWN